MPELATVNDATDWLLETGFKDVSYLMHPGIYILCYRGEVMYVGQSIKPLSRIGNHHGNIEFDAVYFLRCPKDSQNVNIFDVKRLLTEVENKFISLFEPPSNIMGWGNGRVKARRINLRDIKINRPALIRHVSRIGLRGVSDAEGIKWERQAASKILDKFIAAQHKPTQPTQSFKRRF
jgi:hypothetical protein